MWSIALNVEQSGRESGYLEVTNLGVAVLAVLAVFGRLEP